MTSQHAVALEHYLGTFPAPGSKEGRTALQHMTVKIGKVILAGKHEAITTATRDLTAELGRVLEVPGAPISRTAIILLRNLADTTTDASVKQLAEERLGELEMRGFVVTATPDDLNYALAGLTTAALADGVIDAGEAAQIQVLQAAAESANRDRANNGALTQGTNAGILTLPPVDSNIRASLLTRFDIAEAEQTRTGAPKYEFWLAHELQEEIERHRQREPQERVDFYRRMLDAGGVRAYKAFEQLSENGAARMGYVGGMAIHPNPIFKALAIDVERGAQIIEVEGSNRLPPLGKMKQAFEKTLGPALQYAPLRTYEAMFESFQALYVARGGLSTVTNLKSMSELVNEITGSTIHEFNGVKTLLPLGVSEDQMEFIFSNDGMTQNDLADAVVGGAPVGATYATGVLMDGDGDPIGPQRVRARGVLVYVGPNQYMIRDKGKPGWLRPPVGQPYVFDFTNAINQHRVSQ